MVKKEEKKLVTGEGIRTPDYRLIYAVGAAGGFTQYDYRLRFYNEVSMDEKTKKRIIEIPITITMPPLVAKKLAAMLTRQVKEYEEKIGKIKEIDVSKLDKSN